ncbi:MAG: hypothetical protein K1X70_11840 [Leptospirales bacterium]|nr:hypothetical protein [Leptospirales bacterium]
MKQLQDVGHRLIISSISRLAIVSEYYHPEFFPDRYTFLNKVEDLRPEMRYLHFYATRIFQTQFDDVQLRILRKSTHVVDSDGEDLRSEVINVMRFQSYGIPIKIKPTLNFYRLIELIIQGRNRRKIVHKFDELADVFTNVAVLNVVIGCLARWLAFRANRLHFEKSIPGKLTQAGSRTFLPGALLRCIHFAHHSTLPPDVCFSVILHMLDGGRTEYPPVELDWRAHMRSIRAAKNRRTAP